MIIFPFRPDTDRMINGIQYIQIQNSCIAIIIMYWVSVFSDISFLERFETGKMRAARTKCWLNSEISYKKVGEKKSFQKSKLKMKRC